MVNILLMKGWNCLPKLTIGTGSFFVMRRKDRPMHNTLETVAYAKDNLVQYAVEIPLNVGGSTIDWYNSIFKPTELTNLHSDGLYIFPGISGHLYPLWSTHPKSMFLGIKDTHNPSHFFSAILECIGFEISSCLENLNLKELRVDGGVSKNIMLMQLISNCLNLDILLDMNTLEITAYGAALLGSNLEIEKIDYKTISPNSDQESQKEVFRQWKSVKQKLFQKTF